MQVVVRIRVRPLHSVWVVCREWQCVEQRAEGRSWEPYLLKHCRISPKFFFPLDSDNQLDVLQSEDETHTAICGNWCSTASRSSNNFIKRSQCEMTYNVFYFNFEDKCWQKKILSQFPWFHLTCRTWKRNKDSVSPSAQLSALWESDIWKVISHDSISQIPFALSGISPPYSVRMHMMLFDINVCLHSYFRMKDSRGLSHLTKRKCVSGLSQISLTFSSFHCACRVLIIRIRKHLVIVAVWKSCRKKKKKPWWFVSGKWSGRSIKGSKI